MTMTMTMTESGESLHTVETPTSFTLRLDKVSERWVKFRDPQHLVSVRVQRGHWESAGRPLDIVLDVKAADGS
jgi:hypothetical protein